MNPVARGDLQARLRSPRGLRAQTVYLAICSVFLVLSLPPEIGRVDLRDANLLLAVLAVQMVAVTYLSSAVASSELSVEGEKALPDLALSAFAPRAIAVGKAQSSGLYALYLVAIGLPLFVLIAALRGVAPAPVFWAGGLTVAVASMAGIWGAWLSGRYASDFTRSLVHWMLLAALFGGTALLPPSWWPVSPVRLLDHLVREGWTPWLLAVVAGCGILAAAGAVLVSRTAAYARSHEAEV